MLIAGPVSAPADRSRPTAGGRLGRREARAERYGWPGMAGGRPAPPIRSFADFFNWISSQVYGTAPQLGQAQRRWVPVVVPCGRATVAVQERLQLARQRTFLRQHAGAVRALRAAARALIARLERRG